MSLPELYKDTKNSRKGLQSQVNMQKNQEEKWTVMNKRRTMGQTTRSKEATSEGQYEGESITSSEGHWEGEYITSNESQSEGESSTTLVTRRCQSQPNRSLWDIINASVPYLSQSPKEYISSFQKEFSVVTSTPDLVEVFDESLDILASIVDGTVTKEYAWLQ